MKSYPHIHADFKEIFIFTENLKIYCFWCKLEIYRKFVTHASRTCFWTMFCEPPLCFHQSARVCKMFAWWSTISSEFPIFFEQVADAQYMLSKKSNSLRVGSPGNQNMMTHHPRIFNCQMRTKGPCEKFPISKTQCWDVFVWQCVQHIMHDCIVLFRTCKNTLQIYRNIMDFYRNEMLCWLVAAVTRVEWFNLLGSTYIRATTIVTLRCFLTVCAERIVVRIAFLQNVFCTCKNTLQIYRKIMDFYRN